MKAKHLKMIMCLALLTCTQVVYNNFAKTSLSKKSPTKLYMVHEASRTNHAEELLGFRSYKKSDAALLGDTDSLNQRIYLHFKKSLPTKYKNQARKITQTLIRESMRYQMDPIFIMAVIKTESSFNPEALGGVGEIGLMQIKPDTAAWIAERYEMKFKGPKSLKDPNENIRVGVAYFSYLRLDFENLPGSYVNAYNMGPANVRRMLANNKKPKEYSLKVMSNYKKLYGIIAAKEVVVALR